jgi:hypothetical protein
MHHRMLLLAMTALLPVQLSAGPLFDAHLHYNANDAEHYSPRQIIDILDRNEIKYAVVTGTPASQPVLWAHAGNFPYPDLVADHLQRYPALSIDLSVRDDRIAPNGRLNNDWYELFHRFPDRFMVGVDTYRLSSWKDFDSVVDRIRTWLAQLPDEVARRLACDNAAAFSGTGNRGQTEPPWKKKAREQLLLILAKIAPTPFFSTSLQTRPQASRTPQLQSLHR